MHWMFEGVLGESDHYSVVLATLEKVLSLDFLHHQDSCLLLHQQLKHSFEKHIHFTYWEQQIFTAQNVCEGIRVLHNWFQCYRNHLPSLVRSTYKWELKYKVSLVFRLHLIWSVTALTSSDLCKEEHQLEGVHLYDIWASELGWIPSAIHLSCYLTHIIIWLTEGSKTD